MGSVREKEEASRKTQRCLTLAPGRMGLPFAEMGGTAFKGSRRSASEGEFEMPHPSGHVAWVLRHAGSMGVRSRLEGRM